MRSALCTLVESDVLIYKEAEGGYTCAGCFYAPSAEKMLHHVHWHRGQDDYIPRRVDIQLAAG